MDILLIQASAYELPTSRRVGVIVHDGATDTLLWPGPGADRDLAAAYGSDVQGALDRERTKVAGKALPVGGLMRVHPGRLHCDFLIRVGTRGPEVEGRHAQAPDKATLEAAVRATLDFVSERHVIRIAFPALGAGPGAMDEAERLATIARACSAWYEQSFASGRPSTIEEVLICDPRLSAVTGARKMVASLVKAAPADPKAPAPAAAPGRRMASSSSASGDKKKSTRAAPSRKPRLEEGELAHARATARPWDRSIRYGAGDWFVHSKFGVGRVNETTSDDKVVVLFEDGEQRTLINART